MSDESGKPTIAIVMASFNRRAHTLASLKAAELSLPTGVKMRIFIADDASTDGTPEEIIEHFPEAKILRGTGSLYWAASMSLAEREARLIDPDYLLWLNDDTLLSPDAFGRMLQLSDCHPSSIVVGATICPITSVVSYGGRFRTGRHPLKVSEPTIETRPIQVDTFNGNCVLIPRAVRSAVGPIDGLYAHAFADDDYAYRATALGFTIWQVAGAIGQCETNPPTQAQTLWKAWRLLRSPKGLPLRSHARFLRRHGGWEWPVRVLIGQVGFLFRATSTQSS